MRNSAKQWKILRNQRESGWGELIFEMGFSEIQLLSTQKLQICTNHEVGKKKSMVLAILKQN